MASASFVKNCAICRMDDARSNANNFVCRRDNGISVGHYGFRGNNAANRAASSASGEPTCGMNLNSVSMTDNGLAVSGDLFTTAGHNRAVNGDNNAVGLMGYAVTSTATGAGCADLPGMICGRRGNAAGFGGYVV